MEEKDFYSKAMLSWFILTEVIKIQKNKRKSQLVQISLSEAFVMFCLIFENNLTKCHFQIQVENNKKWKWKIMDVFI